NAVVETVADICQELDIVFPEIISESGRALTAHHAVLITNLLGVEEDIDQTLLDQDQPGTPDSPAIKALKRALARCEEMNEDPRFFVDLYQEIKLELHDALSLFISGKISVQQKACIEQFFNECCKRLLLKLDPGIESHRQPLEEIESRLAINVYANFSVFQSTPDIWGIKQVFPVVALTGNNQKPASRTVVQDITCDSDGRLSAYVYGEKLSPFLPLPKIEKDDDFYVAFFLVGAYQEILGDPHNLFGDTYAVSIKADSSETQGWKIVDTQQVQSLGEILELVHYQKEDLLQSYYLQLSKKVIGLTTDEQASLMARLAASLESSTYLDA
ncbi:MAG: hypothetical protein KDI30_00060, partial [Pseudomonadales bacterium]|nr:hypothetical protein [Pseudomonadales bacterium]